MRSCHHCSHPTLSWPVELRFRFPRPWTSPPFGCSRCSRCQSACWKSIKQPMRNMMERSQRWTCCIFVATSSTVFISEKKTRVKSEMLVFTERRENPKHAYNCRQPRKTEDNKKSNIKTSQLPKPTWTHLSKAHRGERYARPSLQPKTQSIEYHHPRHRLQQSGESRKG